MDAKRKVKSVAVVCGGEIRDLQFLNKSLENFDCIIAADSGYDYLASLGIKPNVVIGDFDSVRNNLPEKTEIIKLPKIKDKTDFEETLKYCLSNEISDVTVFGAWGGRPGHSLAAIFAAHNYFLKGLNIRLITERSEMFFVKNKAIINKEMPYVSIFALKNAAKITLEGFKYPLEDYILDNCSPLGVSNEIIGESGLISLKSGDVLVVAEK